MRRHHFRRRIAFRYPIYTLKNKNTGKTLEAIQSGAPEETALRDMADLAATDYPEEYLRNQLIIEILNLDSMEVQEVTLRPY